MVKPYYVVAAEESRKNAGCVDLLVQNRDNNGNLQARWFIVRRDQTVARVVKNLVKADAEKPEDVVLWVESEDTPGSVVQLSTEATFGDVMMMFTVNVNGASCD